MRASRYWVVICNNMVGLGEAYSPCNMGRGLTGVNYGYGQIAFRTLEVGKHTFMSKIV